jgi:hypothetical protein
MSVKDEVVKVFSPLVFAFHPELLGIEDSIFL